VLQRSQRLDLAISDALQDLSVPPGAVELLLSTLASATSASEAPAQETSEPVVNSPCASASDSPQGEANRPDFRSCESAVKERRGSKGVPEEAKAPNHTDAPQRRRSRSGMGAILAAAVIAIAAWWVFQPGAGEFGPDEALNILNSDWLFNVDEAALAQTPIEERQPPSRYSMAQAVSVPATAWRRITDFLGRPGVAYQLRTPAARATLYVVDVEAALDAPQVVDLPAAPSAHPLTTAGKAMSIWREGKLMYVLVVSGGEAEFKSFVTRGGQLAWASNASGHAVPF
jgi:hypothetical protein